MKNQKTKTITVKLTLKELQNSYWSAWCQFKQISEKISNEPDPRERRVMRIEKQQLLKLYTKYGELMQKFGMTDFFELLGQYAVQNTLVDTHGKPR